MSILNDLQELESAGVNSKDTSTRIESYNKNKKDPSTNKLFVVFGILGAISGKVEILGVFWSDLRFFYDQNFLKHWQGRHRAAPLLYGTHTRGEGGSSVWLVDRNKQNRETIP